MDQRSLKSLMNPDAYPEAAGNVRLLQTHISYLFMTDNYVYKIKKPVDFGFLNYTTVDRRRFYCNEEVRLNRRLSPDIYLGVVEIRESTSGATFCGDGTVIDYAVKMKRLPEALMLDRMLADDQVTDTDIREVARVIATFHLNAERGETIDENGSSSSIRRNCEENFRQISEFENLSPVISEIVMIRNWVNTFISSNGAIFAERVSKGFIRDCDGDIHLENICMTSPVCIFDCIEFNDRFRYIDTAADIAFFLMDLDYHGKSIYSNLFLDEYVLRTGDAGLIQLLDFYKVNRAVVRGKVESLKLLDPNIPETEKQVARDKAQRYFRLAREYVLRHGRLPALIITCGLTGSGKSFLASALALELGMQVLSSDIIRKELANIPRDRHCQDEYEKGIYTSAFNEATYRELLERSENLLQAGKSVIVDATFRRKADRARFSELAAHHNFPFYIIHTLCPEELVKQRLDERSRDPGALSDGRWELYPLQKDEFEPPEASEGKLVTIDTSRPLDDNINKITQAMEFADETQIIGKNSALSEP